MYTLLIPKQKSLREKKSGRKGPFWSSFWKKKVAENPEYYKDLFESRVKKLQTSITSINTKAGKDNQRYYVEAKLDELANSKSNEPDAIWKESGVQIVESRKDGSLTLSGSADDFLRLNEIITNVNFEGASKLEKLKKRDNLAREVFSVTALIDRNTTSEKRISQELQDELSSNSNAQFDCCLTVYYDRAFNEYNELYEILVNKIGKEKIKKIDPDLFVSNMSFRAYINKTDIENILSDEACNFINFIKKVPVFGSQRTTPAIAAESVTIGKPTTDEKVVVIDSGIDHQTMNPLIVQRESFLASGQIGDKDHGTAVASRILFGDDFFEKVQHDPHLEPIGKIIDFQVLHKTTGDRMDVDDITLLAAINKAVRKYSDQATIFNLSVAQRTGIQDHIFDESSEKIDALSNERDILFVCACGNHLDYDCEYENIFTAPLSDCRVAAPGDAMNALTVGAIAEKADENSICKVADHPSPFTRKGGFRNDIKKPELVAGGGNVKHDPTGSYSATHTQISNTTYGVPLIGTNGFFRDVGSSFSAPLIARQCLQLLDYLKKSNLPQKLENFSTNKANLIKALLIHSTSRVEQSVIEDNALKRAYGFGKADHLRVLKDGEDQATIVYADKINFEEKKQKILINLPKYLLGKSAEFTFTLVYNPPVNRNFKEYKMIDLQPSLTFIQPMDVGEPNGKTKPSGSLNPKHSWESYRNSSFNTMHFTVTRKRITRLDLQVMIQMMVSNRYLDQFVGNEKDIQQNYAFVLTVKDKSSSGNFHTEMIEINEFQELVENDVQIENEIQ